ncbi:MAG: hypothetical protein RRC34_02385 [Lentisphaeria bacterium]|nr:hypothetical protein [Lentisphaeria bacterium]
MHLHRPRAVIGICLQYHLPHTRGIDDQDMRWQGLGEPDNRLGEYAHQEFFISSCQYSGKRVLRLQRHEFAMEDHVPMFPPECQVGVPTGHGIPLVMDIYDGHFPADAGLFRDDLLFRSDRNPQIGDSIPVFFVAEGILMPAMGYLIENV